eukprot:4367618-Alexandrium_andersonii.AAC.1
MQKASMAQRCNTLWLLIIPGNKPEKHSQCQVHWARPTRDTLGERRRAGITHGGGMAGTSA